MIGLHIYPNVLEKNGEGPERCLVSHCQQHLICQAPTVSKGVTQLARKTAGTFWNSILHKCRFCDPLRFP